MTYNRTDPSLLRRCFNLLILMIACGVIFSAPVRADGTGYSGPYLGGRLLVAAESMVDPRFQRTVILILEHDRTGAFGVILNQVIGSGPLGSLMTGFGIEPDIIDEAALLRDVRLHNGGPVEPDNAVVVHSSEFHDPGSYDVGNGLAWTLDSTVLDASAAGHGPENILVFMGYAGWSAGQLEKEISRDDWLDAAARSDLVFDTPPDDLYEAVQDSVGLSL